MVKNEIYDVAVIGGGINGTGIAAEAASRGLRVLLCEQYDLASATSSASSKLIHGGLRYLETHEYALVQQALNERENLLKNARHLVKPLNFILPYRKMNHSKFIIRLGLFIYDHLSRSSILPKTKKIHLLSHPAGNNLKKTFKTAFQYTDCQTDDSRLVIANALQAYAHHATIMNYVQCTKVTQQQKHWELFLKNTLTQETSYQTSRCLINATGPWVLNFLMENNLPYEHEIILVQGSHIVTRKLYEENFAYILPQKDHRVIFIIPYLEQFHLIGTTEVLFSGSPRDARISSEEIDYLLDAVSQYLSFPLRSTDILQTFSGVRPLLKSKSHDLSKITRDYALELHYSTQFSPLISVFGGKLTTHRKLAESTIDLLHPYFNDLKKSSSATMPLPGSNYQHDQQLHNSLTHQFPWLNNSLLQRYISQYGTKVFELLNKCRNIEDLGKHFGHHLYQKEVDYLVSNEWAKTVEDILLRRTNLNYVFSQESRTALDIYLKKYNHCETKL